MNPETFPNETTFASQLAALVSSSAHAELTPLAILSLQGIVATPLFSMKDACS
jgi:hypothetical protein